MDNATGEALITDYIEAYRDLEISFDRLYLKEKATLSEDSSGINSAIVLGERYTDKYKSDLDDLITMKTFTREEVFKYKCNPWMLSFDLYGTTEFWFLLLDLNDMSSATEFTRTTIKVYDGSLPDVIDAIMANEELFIDNNESELADSDIIENYEDETDDSLVEE